jgi:excisionase family DNA binding protein
MATHATRLLSVRQVAERLGLSRSQVYRMVGDGRLPAVQLGDRGASLRIDEAELRAWLYGAPERGEAA